MTNTVESGRLNLLTSFVLGYRRVRRETTQVNSMNTWIRSALTVAVVLVAYGLMVEAFHLMNLPSNRTFFGGAAMVAGLALGVPLLLHLVWRREL